MSKKKRTLDELLEEALVREDEQLFEIPENWCWVRLGEIVSINPTKPKLIYDDDLVCSFLPMNMVNEHLGSIIQLEERPFSKVKKGYTYFEEGDILFAKITPCMENGNTVIAEGLLNNFGFGSTEFYVLRASRAILNKYIYYLIRSQRFRNQAKQVMAGAVGQQRVPKSFLEEYSFALPPLERQKEIVNKIEILFSKIDEANRLIEEAKKTFELRRASIIKNLIDSSISNVSIEKLDYKELNEVYKIFGGGTPSKSKKEYWNGDVNWFSAKDIKTVYLENSMDKITKLGVENSSAKMADKGSIVVVTRSGILQHSLPIAKLLVDATVNQDLKVFSSNNQLLNDFLLWYLQANEKYLLKEYSKSGTTVNSIEFDRFKTLKIPVLSDDLLKELLFNIEVAIKKEKETYDLLNQEIEINTLKQSILLKAFTGELGTNNSTDKPAIELLKSILQEKL